MQPTRQPIVFVSHPESGLFNPMLVLAEELSRRGVADLYFAADSYRRADVEAAGSRTPITFVPLGDSVPEWTAATWDDETYRAVTQRSRFRAHRALIEHTFHPEASIEKYRLLEAAVERIGPALMVIESMCAYGVELAITKKIRYALSNPFMPSNLLTSHVPLMRSYTPRRFPVPHSGLPYDMTLAQRITNETFKWRTVGMSLQKTMRELLRRDRKVTAELGIAPEAKGFLSRVDHAALILSYTVAELEYPMSYPDTMRLVGTMVPPLPQAPDDGGLGAWLDSCDSVVYMGFGTVTRLTREHVESLLEVCRRLGEQGHHVLWKLPPDQQTMLPPAEMRPDTVRIESWVPSQLDVLAHEKVRVFLTHAGGNGFHEGLYFGVPLVVRPLWIDCDDQAVRGSDFGVSLTLDRPETVDVADVMDKLDRVLRDPAFRDRAAHYRRLLRQAGGRRTAADELLGLLTPTAIPTQPA